MGFLDNSGDIILDAVLTDAGRRRLAAADGTFTITKFALADDEIDYGLYNKNHPSGSAYNDLQILQTPVLEAMTSRSSQLKSKLLSFLDPMKFYMPTIVPNELDTTTKRMDATNNTDIYGVAVSKTSRDSFSTNQGVQDGFAPKEGKAHIRLDQGLDTEQVPTDVNLDAEDLETQYSVQIDNRLGSIVDLDGNSASRSFVDEDNIATYYFTFGANSNFVTRNTEKERAAATQVIDGPRGTSLAFKIASSIETQKSNYLFDQLGATTTMNDKAGSSQNIRYIDSSVSITGITTGYKMDAPVRFFKLSSE